MLQAAGIGYAGRLAGSDEVVMTYFGDGATSEGDFHEAMNFAAVFDCPVVFVCQNNQYAISVPRSRQTKAATLAQKAIAYGMDGIQVDGNDIFACYVAANEAVRRAREDKTPTLIECMTYRLEMHTTADDPTRYREDEEVEKWAERDPIDRFERYLRDQDVLDDDQREAMEKRAEETISKAWDEAKERIDELPGASALFEHIYAEEPERLTRQRAWFDAENDSAEGRDNG
jgi:pyruvate dehydrogenase E1 component alpha subunit